jgi:predicted transcriptional regulator
VTRCKLWKQKNELEKLNQKMQDDNYLNNLLNAMKNKRRQKLLQILSEGRHSIVQLQQKMNRLGWHQSQGTIEKEYITPLMKAGLTEKEHSQYYTTLFGYKLNESTESTGGLSELLPPHSKCYEERVIESLAKSPKPYRELEKTIATETLSRVLKRLQTANLITKDKRRSYIFHFKTRRDPRKEKLSPTEKRVYQNISEEGIPAQELARKTNISLRRTYKYLRRLRGKKLVFKRKLPKKYSLTEEGMKNAEFLEKTQTLLIEFTQASKESSKKTRKPTEEKMVSDASKTLKEKLPEILV